MYLLTAKASPHCLPARPPTCLRVSTVSASVAPDATFFCASSLATFGGGNKSDGGSIVACPAIQASLGQCRCPSPQSHNSLLPLPHPPCPSQPPTPPCCPANAPFQPPPTPHNRPRLPYKRTHALRASHLLCALLPGVLGRVDAMEAVTQLAEGLLGGQDAAVLVPARTEGEWLSY